MLAQKDFLVSFGLGFHENSYKMDHARLNLFKKVVSIPFSGNETPKDLNDQAREELIRYYAGINEFKPEQVHVQVYSVVPSVANA